MVALTGTHKDYQRQLLRKRCISGGTGREFRSLVEWGQWQPQSTELGAQHVYDVVFSLGNLDGVGEEP